jgi:hypothetical protein
MKCWRFALFAILAVALAAAACGPHHHHGDDDSSPPADDDNDTTTPDDDDNDDASPPADDDDLATDIFVVGDHGAILHFDGTTWSPMQSGTTVDLGSTWGASGSDVYASGTTYQYYESPLASAILHYDGSTWSSVRNFPTTQKIEILAGLWGMDSSNVFVAGGEIFGYETASNPLVQGIIFQYNGVSWSIAWQYGAFYLGYFTFAGIWGSSASDVFAVGNWDNEDLINPVSGFVVAHFDGNSWTPMHSASNVGGYYHLSAIWGASHSNVFAVGNSGYPNYGDMVLHYDGSQWSEMSVPEGGGGLYSVWGTSSTAVFSTGATPSMGYVLYYDSYDWSRANLDNNTLFYGLWGASPHDVFTAGDSGQGVIYHYNGSSWSPIDVGANIAGLAGIWGTAR